MRLYDRLENRMSNIVKKVYFDYPAETSQDAIEFLSDKAVKLGIADDRDAVLKAFEEREALGPTGMTRGFALPHAKTNAVKEPAVVVVKFSDKVEWKALGTTPIRAAIAIYVPEDDAATHLAILSKIATLLMDADFCEKVMDSTDDETIAALIEKGLA